MKQKEIEVGGVYHARISGKFVHVRVDSIGENYSGRTVYAVTNLMTGRKVTFRSAMRFRGKVIPAVRWNNKSVEAIKYVAGSPVVCQ